jgi:predicted transcriptional regulator YdeE
MKFVEIEGFQVAGMAARTSNAREMTGEGVIPQVWGRSSEIGGAEIFALYTEYANDEHGEYTFVLGKKADRAFVAPQDFVLKTVPGGRYAVYTSARGPVQKVVFETWQRIWSEMPAESNTRSYIADFEVYDQRAADPADAVVDVYVGVK